MEMWCKFHENRISNKVLNNIMRFSWHENFMKKNALHFHNLTHDTDGWKHVIISRPIRDGANLIRRMQNNLKVSTWLQTLLYHTICLCLDIVQGFHTYHTQKTHISSEIHSTLYFNGILMEKNHSGTSSGFSWFYFTKKFTACYLAVKILWKSP